MLVSLYKMWPDFTLEETGYEDLYRLFRYATDAGEDVAVVDAMTFSENPAGVLAAYCEHLEVPFTWLPHVGVEGCSQMGELGGVARGCREQHRYRAGRAQGPRVARGARGRLRALFALLLRAGGARDPIRGAAIRPGTYKRRKEKILLRTESQIAPHGGELVDRVVPEEERRERSMEAVGLPKVPLSPRALSDLQMISTGVFSPLEGFMLRDEYEAWSRTCA